MAVKIEQYQDRLTPAGGQNVQARGAQFTDAIGASLQNLGQAGQNFANVNLAIEKHNNELLKQKDEADAITDAGKKLSDASVEWNKWMEEKKRTAPAGAPGFYDEVDKQYNTWRDQTLTTITEPKARQYAERTLNNQRDNVLGQALQFQAHAGVSKRLNDLEDTTRNYEATVAASINQYPTARQAVLGVIANDPTLDANTKSDVARKITDRLTLAALNGELQRNPGETKDALMARLGKTQLTPDEERALRATGATISTPSGSGAGRGLPPNVARYSALINEQATAYGVDPVIMSWQMNKESSGNPNAKGSSGEIGLTQFMPGTAAKYGVKAGDEASMVRGQAMYMRDLLKMFGGDYQKALAGYNWGEGNVQKAIQKNGDNWLQSAPKGVQDYVSQIMTNAGKNGSAPASSFAGTNTTITGQPVVTINADLENLVNQLPQQQVIPMLHAAQTEVNRVQATYQSALKTTEADHMTAYANGETVSRPLSEGEYQKAYGPVEGSQRFSEYQKAQELGVAINTVKTLPVDQQQTYLEARRPDPSQPGYALAVQRYDLLTKAVQAANQNRAADPMAWAISNKVGNVQTLDFNDRQKFGTELANRAGVAATMQQSYGTGMSLLTKAEQQTLVAGFGVMTTQQKLDYLKTMRSAVKDPFAYRALVQQIAPDSPITAVAGALMGETRNNVIAGGLMSSDTVYRPDQVAGLILEGEQLLNPSKGTKAEDGRGKPIAMPEEKDMRGMFADQMGNAFAGNAGKADVVYQAVKAYYAGKSAREGDVSGKFDNSRMKEAIEAVTGGATEINGKGSVVRPWGMSENYFKDQAKKSFDAQVKANGYTGGMFDQWGAYGLQNLDDPGGQGRDLYLVRTGTGYLFGRDGKPMVLDMTQSPSLVDQIPKSNAQDIPQPPAPLPPVNAKPEKPVNLNTTKPKTK